MMHGPINIKRFYIISGYKALVHVTFVLGSMRLTLVNGRVERDHDQLMMYAVPVPELQ